MTTEDRIRATAEHADCGEYNPGVVRRDNWVELASDDEIPDALDEEMAMLQNRLGRIPRRQQLERTIKRRVKKTLELRDS